MREKMISKEFIEPLQGLSEQEAISKIETSPFKYRIIEKNGEVFAITCDYCIDRINLIITDGKVKNVFIG